MVHTSTPDAGYRAQQVMHPGWVARHASGVDVAHVHFGFGDVPIDQMHAWLAALRRHRIPLVYTVHDLHNPHVTDQAGHERRRDLLLEHADALITLTEPAADQVSRLCGRRPMVLPHPHVVPPGVPRRTHSRPGRTVVGIHCKDHRGGIDALPFIDALLDVMADRPDVVLRIDAHHVLDDRRPDIARTITALRAHGRVQVHRSGWLPDALLWAYLSHLDLAVLPYCGGTHSGWLEACADLGTPAVVPDHLPAAVQQPRPHVLPLPIDGRQPRRDVLAHHLDHVRTTDVRQPLAPRLRARQRHAVARAHHDLYATLLETRT